MHCYAFIMILIFSFSKSFSIIPSGQIWSQDLKFFKLTGFGRGVHCYILIRMLMFIFSKTFFIYIYFRANLVPKSYVFQTDQNLVRWYINYCNFKFNVYFFKSFVIHVILGKFGSKIWNCPNWLESRICVYVINTISWL